MKAHRKAKLVEEEIILDIDAGPITFRESMLRQTLVDPESGEQVWSRTTDNWMYE